MIVDLVALQGAIAHHITDPLDHTFLNKDIPYFAQTVPTAENIVIYICRQLYQPIQDIGATLHKVKLIESPNNSAEIFAASLFDAAPSSSQTAPLANAYHQNEVLYEQLI